MSDDPKRAGLEKAGRFLMSEVRKRAPTERSARSFHIVNKGDGLAIVSEDQGTWATVGGFRHPLYGNRDRWYGPSKSQRGRKDFPSKAADAAAQEVADRFGDEWVRTFVAESSIWTEVNS